MSISLLCCSGSLEGGGSERQLWQLVCKLPRPQFDLGVYLLYRKGLFLDQLPQEMRVDDFWSHHSVRDFRWPGSIHAAQVRHLAQIVDQGRIQVVYDRTFHMTLVTAPACKRAGVPRVSVIVSPPSQDFVRAGERFAWLKHRRLRAAYSDPNSVAVAVSGAVADDAAEFYGIDREAIVVVPSPIDLDSVREKSGVETPLSKGVPIFCVVGRLSSEKGQKLAIDAFAIVVKEHSDARLRLIGDGPDRDLLQRHAAALGIDGRVEFLGFQQNPYPAIAAATALVIPSEYEGLPNVALEAMALRTPVIATRCSGAVIELLGRGERGVLVETGNADGLARAMLQILGEGKHDSQVDKAESWVEQHHSLPAWIEQMASLFEKVCTIGPSAARGGV